ncbi:hypothetical protein EMPG_11989 [Blastomyces silverae]|uniref:Uncharacterized protein n=1 Tax=Blastomyces silverae TaxID=2060906 RepID=A0A0H1BPV2_9EURO|nr:hypothetical protein EMPG_11989 [Blastomyces silverae]
MYSAREPPSAADGGRPKLKSKAASYLQWFLLRQDSASKGVSDIRNPRASLETALRLSETTKLLIKPYSGEVLRNTPKPGYPVRLCLLCLESELWPRGVQRGPRDNPQQQIPRCRIRNRSTGIAVGRVHASLLLRFYFGNM